MQGSWLSKFLPKDEYKEKVILYFLAEAAVILSILLLILALVNNYSIYGNNTTGTVVLLSFVFLIGYVLVRVILSGIEYSEVATEKRYRKERKEIVQHSLLTMVILSIIFAMLKGFPSTFAGTWDLIDFPVYLALSIYAARFISLKRSYKKNKDLVD